MNSVVRKGANYYLHSCWGPPQLLQPRRDNPLLTPDVLRAILWLRRHPGVRMRTVAARDAQLGGMADDLVEGLLPAYTKAIKKYEPILYEQGRKTGKSLASAVWGAAFSSPRDKASGPKWMPKVIDPVLQPFTRGLAAEAGPRLLLPLAAALVGIFGLGYAIGRRRALR